MLQRPATANTEVLKTIAIIDIADSPEAPAAEEWASKEGLTKRQAAAVEQAVDDKIRNSNREYVCSCCTDKFLSLIHI